MARANFVKHAQKDNSVAKKGEPYYWWKFRFGGKHFSKTPPRQSQLTQSDFLSTVYGIQEEIEDLAPETLDDLTTSRDDIVERIHDLASEQEDKHSNMPDSLQDSDTGQLLESRGEELNAWADDLEGVDIPDEEEVKSEATVEDPVEGETPEEKELREARNESAVNDAVQEALDNALSEIQGTSYNGE